MKDELHIAGIVVHARPGEAASVATAVAAGSGAVVHVASPEGKLVVTLEAATAREVAARIEAIQRLDGVLSALLVYQHNESLEAMMEEVSHENHPA